MFKRRFFIWYTLTLPRGITPRISELREREAHVILCVKGSLPEIMLFKRVFYLLGLNSDIFLSDGRCRMLQKLLNQNYIKFVVKIYLRGEKFPEAMSRNAIIAQISTDFLQFML